MLSVCRLKKRNVRGLFMVSNILYKCGKDMANKYNLRHWNNSHIKTWIITLACATKNNMYLVYNGKTPVATFQTKKIDQSLMFEKLATLPDCAGKGIGTFCLNEIENIGREKGCSEIVCEVYMQSEHARCFYEHKGFRVYGIIETLKYKELQLKKDLRGKL